MNLELKWMIKNLLDYVIPAYDPDNAEYCWNGDPDDSAFKDCLAKSR